MPYTNRINSTGGGAVLVIVALLFAGCLAVEPDMHAARVTVDMEVHAGATLAKGEAVILSKILVLMVSNKKDTVYDVITPNGSRLSQIEGTFLAASATSQIVSARYDLLPHRTWKITITLMDAKDSIRQADTLKVPKLEAFEYRTVAMCLHPRFTVFNAHFFLPSEISVHESASTFRVRKVYFTHLNLTEGEEVKCDTNTFGGKGAGFMQADPGLLRGSEGMLFFKTGSFGETPAILLADEYVKVGIRTFVLNAYGYLEGDTIGVTPLRLLFRGNQSVNTALAKEAGSVAMEWQASDVDISPDLPSGSNMKVTLGAVGTIIINVRTSGEIDF